jgi:hypothetical protein
MGDRLHPLHAKGKYYVDSDTCLCQDSCVADFPEHFARNEMMERTAYVYKQPKATEEEAACKSAMACCGYEAIFDDGDEIN